jgi:hypothetical protein
VHYGFAAADKVAQRSFANTDTQKTQQYIRAPVDKVKALARQSYTMIATKLRLDALDDLIQRMKRCLPQRLCRREI